MTKKKHSELFHGIIPPIVTPLLSNYQLDVEGLHRLLYHILDGGVHGIFILGTTGESTSLSYRVRSELIRRTCEFVNGKVPVLVGITDTSIEESLNLASIAYDSGAAAVVSAPPYYFQVSQLDLIDYYRTLADSLPLPLFLYNIPFLTKININIETVIALAKHSNIIGLKDSSGNVKFFHIICQSRELPEDFILLAGNENNIAEAVFAGGDGGIAGGANVFPRLYVELYEAAVAQNLLYLKTLESFVGEVESMLYTLGGSNYGNMKGIKGALSIMNITNIQMVPPLRGFQEDEIAKFKINFQQVESNLLKHFSINS